jgi:hypothetical protein
MTAPPGNSTIALLVSVSPERESRMPRSLTPTGSTHQRDPYHTPHPHIDLGMNQNGHLSLPVNGSPIASKVIIAHEGCPIAAPVYLPSSPPPKND